MPEDNIIYTNYIRRPEPVFKLYLPPGIVLQKCLKMVDITLFDPGFTSATGYLPVNI